jgi:hypothetical protein
VEPDGKPLEDRLGRARCVGFMYMGRINGVHLYKHGITRTYLQADDAGNCFVPTGKGCYAPADWDQEIRLLEECLRSLGATLETPYDDGFKLRQQLALKKEGISLVTLDVEPADFLIH